jgi:membrane protease YdiL (CAAX protease family)
MNNLLLPQFALSSLVPLLIYLVCAFAFTWFFHFQIVRKNLKIDQGQGLTLYVLGFPGPALAAVGVAVAFGSTGQLWQRLLQWRVGFQWWLLAVFIIPSIYIVATGIHVWRSGLKTVNIFHHPSAGWVTLLLRQLYVVCSEEIGWRGFALPLLIGIFGTAGGSLILGLMWALWHLPMFRVPASYQKGAFWGYSYTLITWSLIITLLVIRSGGSILPAMAFHAAANISFFVMDVPHEAERYITPLLGLVALLCVFLLPAPWIALNP